MTQTGKQQFWAFNRTFKELKLRESLEKVSTLQPFNRTFKELKLDKTFKHFLNAFAFNRTFKELKRYNSIPIKIHPPIF